MKKVLIAVAFLAAFAASSAQACSKDEAKGAVEQACKLVADKGKDALGELAKFRFCGDNYVWIQDTTSDVKMVMHPVKAKMNGKPLTDQADEKGKKLFVEFDKAAKASKDGAWVDYVWPKPGSSKAVPKTSFVKLCPGGLGWVAGAGVWTE